MNKTKILNNPKNHLGNVAGSDHNVNVVHFPEKHQNNILKMR